MQQIQIATDNLFKDYGIENNSIQDVMSVSSEENIFYVLNPKHDPKRKPPIDSAWVAVHKTECAII